MSSLRLALKQSLAESTLSHQSPASTKSSGKNDRKRPKGTKLKRVRDEDHNGNSADEHELDSAEDDHDHSSGSGMAEDEMSSLNGSDEEDSRDKGKETSVASPCPAKKKSRHTPLSIGRSFDGDDEQSGAGRASEDESEEDIPIHANDAARRSSHESASKHEQDETKDNDDSNSIHSPLPKKKKKKKKQIKSQPRAMDSHDEEETKTSTEDDCTNPVEKKKKKKRAPGVVPKPTPKVLSWVRSMSINKQRRHVKVGHRIKVQFALGTKKNGNRRLRWFGAEILEVLPNAKKIRVRYDDGTVEACEFPDSDIIVDADDNGSHTEEAGGNDPFRNPFLPQPTSTDSTENEGTLNPTCEEKHESINEEPGGTCVHMTENESEHLTEDHPHERTDEECLKKPKKKNQKKLKASLEESARDDANRSESHPQEPSSAQHDEGTRTDSPATTRGEVTQEPKTPSDMSSMKKKKKKGSKLRLKLSSSKETGSAQSSVVPASSSNDESGNHESDDNPKDECTSAKPTEDMCRTKSPGADKAETLTQSISAFNEKANAQISTDDGMSPTSRLVSTDSSKVESTKKASNLSVQSISRPSPSTKPRIKIGIPESSTGKVCTTEKAPSLPRLQIDLKRVLSASCKKRSSPDASNTTKAVADDDAAKEQVLDQVTPKPNLPFETSKTQIAQSTNSAHDDSAKPEPSPSGEHSTTKKGKTVSKAELDALECMSPRGPNEPQTPILTPGSLADAVKLGRHRKPHTSDQKSKELPSPSSTKPKKRRRRVEEESPEIAESPGQDSINTTGDENWVQCDACQKWRLLPDTVDMDSLPERWYCELNTYDRKRMTCSAPEQTAADVMRERIAKLTPRKRRKKLTTPKTEKGSPLEVPLLQGEAGVSQSPGHPSSSTTDLDLPMLPLSTSKSEDHLTQDGKVEAGTEGQKLSEMHSSVLSPIPSNARATANPVSLQPRANSGSKLSDLDLTSSNDASSNMKECQAKDKSAVQKQPKRSLSGGSMKSKSTKADDDTATESSNSRDETTAVGPRDKAKRRHRKKEKIDREAAAERACDAPVRPPGDNVSEQAVVLTKGKKEVEPTNTPSKTPMKANDSQEWVQCEKCYKWRRLPPSIKAEDLGDEWYCTLNTWDIKAATCAAPEDFATAADAKANSTSRDNPNDIFGNEKTTSGKVSYRNLIFGTAGRRQTRPTSERARAADSLFISPPNEDAGEIHPTVQYANSSCFVQRSIRTKPEELDTGLALLELMSGTRLWQGLWKQTSSHACPVTTTSSRTVSDPQESSLQEYHQTQSAPDTFDSQVTNDSNTRSNGSSSSPSPVASSDPEALNESMKALVYHAMGTHHTNALTKYEILLEVQCRNWNIPESKNNSSNASSMSWVSLRSACTLEWVDYCLSELVKDGLVQRLAPLDGANGTSTPNEGSAAAASSATTSNNGCGSNTNHSGTNCHGASKGVRYRKIIPSTRPSNYNHPSSINIVGHPTRCVKLAKPWKSVDHEKLKQCHWTDTQECEALLQEQQEIFNRQRFEHLYETLGPDPTSSLVSTETASFSTN